MQKARSYGLVVALGLFWVTPALCGTELGQSPAATQVELNCQRAMTQTAMNICSSEAYQAEDARLNQNYQALRAKLDPKQKAQRKRVQLVWLKYRDGHCAFESARYEGGSIYPMIVSGCRLQLTQQRSTLLSELLSEAR